MAPFFATGSIQKDSPSDYRMSQMADFSGLLSTLSDELRQPLSIAIQSSQLLQRQYSGSLSPKQMALVENILEQNRYVLNRVDTCLQVAQLETTQNPLFLSPIDLKQVIPDVLTNVRTMSEDQTVVFNLTWEMEQTDVICDRNHLYQLLTKVLHQITQAVSIASAYKLKIVDHSKSWCLRILLPATYPIENLRWLQTPQRDDKQYNSPICTLEVAVIRALLSTLEGSLLVQDDTSERFVQLTLPRTLCSH